MSSKRIHGIVSVMMICVAFTLIICGYSRVIGRKVSGENIRYIIDAGHGIPDGGAVGVDGTTEQELNLAIALKLSTQLDQRSVAHMMTRTDENSIYSEGETIHAKKVSDVKNRISIANENSSIPLVSIHMNSYPNSSVHGIQVFYSDGNTQAKDLADLLQNSFNTAVQPENTKVTKAISKNVYLFSHVSNPSVLIECGFVSNSDELNKLKTEEYQQQLANLIADVLASCG
ncbi:MAG: N-acetylmuramoyl-L-alanine amidase [Clostridia bacterium]|nr:N-acetylmuramoyl-L-alanine amidase [Clostridia bacterium]